MASVGANVLLNALEGKETVFLSEGLTVYRRSLPDTLSERPLADRGATADGCDGSGGAGRRAGTRFPYVGHPAQAGDAAGNGGQPGIRRAFHRTGQTAVIAFTTAGPFVMTACRKCGEDPWSVRLRSVSYTHLRAHETRHDLVC